MPDIEGQVDLGSDLEQAWNDAEVEVEVEEVEEEAPPEEVEEVKEEAAEPKEEEAPPEEEAAPEPVKVPDHWSEEDKASFAAIPAENQEWMMARYKSMEGDYTRKSQAVAEERKAWESVEAMYSPYQQQLQQSNMTMQQHMQGMLNADRMLSQNPVDGMQQLAKMYGVELQDLVDTPAVSAEIQQMQQQLNQLQAEKNQQIYQQQQLQTQKQSSIVGDITAFQDSGKAPHFDAVVDQMIEIARSQQANGKSPILAEIYEQAIWANPSIRAELLDQQLAEKQEASLAQSKKQAAIAAKAKKSIHGTPNGNNGKPQSLRDQILNSF